MTDKIDGGGPATVFRAYYYEFWATGVAEIDGILDAVASAGNCYPHTESWIDEGMDGSPSFAVRIQEAANCAADAMLAARKK